VVGLRLLPRIELRSTTRKVVGRDIGYGPFKRHLTLGFMLQTTVGAWFEQVYIPLFAPRPGSLQFLDLGLEDGPDLLVLDLVCKHREPRYLVANLAWERVLVSVTEPANSVLKIKGRPPRPLLPNAPRASGRGWAWASLSPLETMLAIRLTARR
jgi:hypothetical protein